MKWQNSNEWIDMNELKRKNWNERIDMNDVDLIFKTGRNPSVFDGFLWSTTWCRCGRQMKWSSRYSLAHTLSTSLPTSSSKRTKKKRQSFTIIYVKSSSRNTVPCTFCRPHLQKSCRFLCEIALSLYSLVHMCRPHLQKVVRPRQFKYFKWNGALATVLCTCCRPHLQKVQKNFWVVLRFYKPSSSRNSFAHILSTSSSKLARTNQFFTISMWHQALTTVLCTFSRPHVQKVVWTRHFLIVFDHIYVKSSSRNSLVHILSTSSSKSGPTPSV